MLTSPLLLSLTGGLGCRETLRGRGLYFTLRRPRPVRIAPLLALTTSRSQPITTHLLTTRPALPRQPTSIPCDSPCLLIPVRPVMPTQDEPFQLDAPIRVWPHPINTTYPTSSYPFDKPTRIVPCLAPPTRQPYPPLILCWLHSAFR